MQVTDTNDVPYCRCVMRRMWLREYDANGWSLYRCAWCYRLADVQDDAPKARAIIGAQVIAAHKAGKHDLVFRELSKLTDMDQAEDAAHAAD